MAGRFRDFEEDAPVVALPPVVVLAQVDLAEDVMPDQDGMVKCWRCKHGQPQGRSSPSGVRMVRCRHGRVHSGRWVLLSGDAWRRCWGFQ